MRGESGEARVESRVDDNFVLLALALGVQPGYLVLLQIDLFVFAVGAATHRTAACTKLCAFTVLFAAPCLTVAALGVYYLSLLELHSDSLRLKGVLVDFLGLFDDERARLLELRSVKTVRATASWSAVAKFLEAAAVKAETF